MNLGDYEEEPRITRICADKYERGERPIRGSLRNPRLDFSRCIAIRVSSVFDPWLFLIWLRVQAALHIQCVFERAACSKILHQSSGCRDRIYFGFNRPNSQARA